MFKVDVFKSNKKYIIISIICIIVFTIMNLFVNTNYSFSELSDDITGIHKLVINELMSSNTGSLVDEKGNLCDWIEIYNGYEKNIQLKNYGLSDSSDGRIKWIFPEMEIKSKEYIIIYLTSEEVSAGFEELHAPFSLKQDGGEIITLKQPNGKIVDSVKTISLTKNASMSRDTNGKWISTTEITPGYENSKKGREKFLQNINNKEATYPLAITEFLPANEGNVLFSDNKLYSYIEVTNVSEETINLQDYYLSNSEEMIYKWRFSNVQLKKGESYLVYADSQKKKDHVSFRLKHKTGNVILSTYNGIVENVHYEELPNGVAYVKENNKWRQNANVSPGYKNDDEGKTLFQKEIDLPKKDLIISEVMSSNNQYLAQNGNQYYDWIEIYNNSDHSIHLSDYALSTDFEDKKMYILPEKELLPGNYYILMASGNSYLSNSSYFHTNFKLSSGTGLFLFKDQTTVDSLYIYSIPKGYSYGRTLTYGHFYYPTPTPGSANHTTALKKIQFEPIFSKEGGIYNNVASLSIELDNSNFNEIYYTLDGSIPTTSSIKYKEPITIYKTTTIRAASYVNGSRISDVITNNYIMNENHTLPVLAVSLPESSFKAAEANYYQNISYPAHAELYEKDSSFSIDCNFKIFGGLSREYTKKSYSLVFEPTNLLYKLFDNREIQNFSNLVIRSGSQEQFNSMMRDELTSSIMIKYGTIDAQAAKPTVLYINGKYHGLYFIREKIDEHFIEKNYNVKGPTNIVSSYYQTEEGTNQKVLELRNYINSHNIRDNSAYEYVKTLLDMDNYIDYWVYEFIINNYDLHNMRFYNNPNIANGKIRMILYDSDYTLLSNYGASYMQFIQTPKMYWEYINIDTSIITNLLTNDSFKKRFVERVAYYLKNVWTEENVLKEFDKLYQAIKPEMPRECERWARSYDAWKNNANTLKNTIIQRPSQIKSATKEYFHLSQEEVNAYFS